MDKEASSIASVITAFLIAVFGLAAAFGFHLDDAQRTAVLAVVGPTVAAVLLLGQILRSYVWSKHSVQAVADAAYAAGKSGQTQPPIDAPAVVIAPPVVSETPPA